MATPPAAEWQKAVDVEYETLQGLDVWELVPLPEGNRYLGFVFARGATPDEVERTLREAHRRLAFDIR